MHKTAQEWMQVQAQAVTSGSVAQAMNVLQMALDDLQALNRKITAMTEVMIECEDYMDNRADADMDQDGYIPNKEMRILTDIRSVL